MYDVIYNGASILCGNSESRGEVVVYQWVEWIREYMKNKEGDTRGMYPIVYAVHGTYLSIGILF